VRQHLRIQDTPYNRALKVSQATGTSKNQKAIQDILINIKGISIPTGR